MTQGVKGTISAKRVCPQCGGRKGYYAEACRSCKVYPKPMLGRKGVLHPAWKRGFEIDRDGYIRTYNPNHPWPRKNGYVRENVRVMELHIGHRLKPNEVVHHKDGNKTNNDLHNLEIMTSSAHSREHRKLDGAPWLYRGPRKLNAESVAVIKKRLRSGESQQKIADDFGVAQTLISFISRGKVWCHVS